ncbi:MAG TPA: hypothetical protein VFB63_19420 [Bryobacteraceae bacterium]|nr:hypothetical protein [Bryobacteraceae bacterium]
MFGGDGGAGKEARRARQEEQQRQLNISTGTADTRNKFAHTFDKKYYDDLVQNVKNYYQPDVDKQFADAAKAMEAGLMRAGLFNSYVASKKEKEKETARLRGNTAVNQMALGAKNQRVSDVEFAQNQVLNQLNATGDSSAAFANAASAIKANYDAPAMPMLGQVITDLSAGLATQADLERNNQNRRTLFGRIPGWSTGGGSRYTRTVGG